MKVFKSIMLYLLILLGLVTAAVLICCIIMICSPNTPILGYKYISYKNVIEDHKDISKDNITAISVTSNRMDIKIIPNASSSNVNIVYSQGMSGFVKKDANDLQVTMTIKENQEFESGDGNYGVGNKYKTLCIDVKEPDGLIFLADCYIRVYLPAGKTYSVIYANSKNGGIEYTSNNEGKSIGVANLYLHSSSKDINKKSININKPNAQRYYIKTSVGQCYFINGGADITGNVIFETSGGKLIAKDGALKGNLTVRSSEKVNGATLDITNLYGNLTFVAKSGNISIANIDKGSNTAYPVVDIQAEYCNIKIGTLRGTIKTQGYEGGNIDDIDATIKNLYYISSLDNIDINSGKGNINITNLSGDAFLKSITGNITVSQANGKNLYLETYNGSINVTFAEAELQLQKLDVKVLKRSSIKLRNLQGTVNIDVGEGTGRTINLGFAPKVIDNAVACQVNITASKDNVLLSDIGAGRFAVYSDGKITGDVAQCSDINASDKDRDTLHSKPYQMRFNYTAGYAGIYSKIYIHNRSTSSNNACPVRVEM